MKAKNLFFYGIISSFLSLTQCQQPNKTDETSKAETTTSAASANEKVLRHVVLFKFKDTSSKEAVKTVEEAFRALPKQIKEIKDFEFGVNNSPENLNEGFTHCFFVSFASENDRAVYLPHPAHKAFVEVLKPHLDKVCVLDYWAGE